MVKFLKVVAIGIAVIFVGRILIDKAVEYADDLDTEGYDN